MWNEDALRLKTAGFSGDEINQEKETQRQSLLDGGFSEDEVRSHFGETKRDDVKMKAEIANNIKTHIAENTSETGKPKEMDFVDSMAAGLKMAPDAFKLGAQKSIAGMTINQGLPAEVLPENAPMFARAAETLGQLVPDLPAMSVGGGIGGVIGGTLGTLVAPGAGTALGVTLGYGAGSFGIPAFVRTMMIEHYEKGWSKNFSEFWSSVSAASVAATKEGIIGAATAGVGGAVSKGLSKMTLPKTAQATAVAGSELATMVSTGAAIEGEMPRAQDFVDGALVIGALHGSMAVSMKMGGVFAKTGVKPLEVVEQSKADVTIKQDLVSENVETPSAYKPLEETPSTEKIVEVEAMKTNEGLNPEFAADTLVVKEEPIKPEPKKIEEPVTPEAGSLDEAHAKIESKLASKKEETKYEKTLDYLKDSTQNLYQNYIDKFDPIKKAISELSQGKGVLAARDAYVQARLANDAPAKAKLFMEFETLDYNTLQKNGEGLARILKPITSLGKGELNKFNNYLVARRVYELELRKINSGFDVEAAKKILVGEEAKFEKVAKEVTEYQNRLTKYLKDAGFLSEETYQSMLDANGVYVPLKRLFAEELTPTNKKSKSSPIKKIKGVKSDDILTVNPLESILENTVFYTKLAEKNRAVRTLVEQALKTKDQTVIEQVAQTAKPVRAKSGELLDLLKANEIAPEDLDVVGFAKQNYDLTPNQFEVWRNGKREIYETTPELATAIKALDGDPLPQNVVFKLAKGAASVLRSSLAITPDFIARNFFRDQMSSAVLTKEGLTANHLGDTFAALKELMAKDKGEAYIKWLSSGGAGGTFLELSKSYLEKDVFNLAKETGMMERAWNVVASPFHFLRVSAELTEQATRFAEFKRVTGGDYSKNKLMEGGMAAREVTIDFQRIGLKMSALNAITAFQNVGIQALDREARAFKANPKQFAARGALLITTPSVLLWAANKDDKRYQDLPSWQKNMFWVVITDKWERPGINDDISNMPDHLVTYDAGGLPLVNNGTIYRIPKPQTLGLVFGSAVERTLDAFSSERPDLDIAKDFGGSLVDMTIPSLVPTVATPFLEAWANKSLFTGNPIVSSYAEKLLPEYRYTEYTSEVAKASASLIAHKTGSDFVSPQVIDNWIMAWTGNAGRYAMKIADQGLISLGIVPDLKPASSLADIPVIQAFVIRNPSNGMQPIVDFYEKYKKYEMAVGTITTLEDRGDLEAAEYERSRVDMVEAQLYLGYGEAMKNMRQQIHSIYKNPEIPKAEKRQQIDGLYYMINEIAKKAATGDDE